MNNYAVPMLIILVTGLLIKWTLDFRRNRRSNRELDLTNTRTELLNMMNLLEICLNRVLAKRGNGGDPRWHMVDKEKIPSLDLPQSKLLLESIVFELGKNFVEDLKRHRAAGAAQNRLNIIGHKNAANHRVSISRTQSVPRQTLPRGKK